MGVQRKKPDDEESSGGERRPSDDNSSVIGEEAATATSSRSTSEPSSFATHPLARIIRDSTADSSASKEKRYPPKQSKSFERSQDRRRRLKVAESNKQSKTLHQTVATSLPINISRSSSKRPQFPSEKIRHPQPETLRRSHPKFPTEKVRRSHPTGIPGSAVATRPTQSSSIFSRSDNGNKKDEEPTIHTKVSVDATAPSASTIRRLLEEEDREKEAFIDPVVRERERETGLLLDEYDSAAIGNDNPIDEDIEVAAENPRDDLPLITAYAVTEDRSSATTRSEYQNDNGPMIEAQSSFDDEETKIVEAQVLQFHHLFQMRNLQFVVLAVLIFFACLIAVLVAVLLTVANRDSGNSNGTPPTPVSSNNTGTTLSLVPTFAPTSPSLTVAPTIATMLPTTSSPTYNIFAHPTDNNQTEIHNNSIGFSPTDYDNNTDFIYNQTNSSNITYDTWGVLTDVPLYTILALQNQLSPQYKAYRWLENHPNESDIPQWRKRQMFAMVTFYYAMDGDAWIPIERRDGDERYGWLDYNMNNISECDWGYEEEDGIGNLCDNTTGRLIRLRIDKVSNVQGFLPPEVAYGLPSLETIDVYRTDIKGNLSYLLPPQLKDLVNLTKLSYFKSENNLILDNLAGTIPAHIGSTLMQLQELTLYDHEISGTIPSEVGNMTNLEILDIQNNAIRGSIPSEIGKLTNLRRLLLDDNDLSGAIPEELLSRLISVEELGLHRNKLIGPFPSLSTLHIAANDTGIDTNLTTSANNTATTTNLFEPISLKALSLYGNSGLFGTIPEVLCFYQVRLLVDCSGNLTCPETCDCTCCDDEDTRCPTNL